MDVEGVSMVEFKDVFLKGNLFVSGLSVDYGLSFLVVKSGDFGELGDRSGRSWNLEGVCRIIVEEFEVK